MNQKHLLRFIKSKLKKAPNVSFPARQFYRNGVLTMRRRSSFTETAKI